MRETKTQITKKAMTFLENCPNPPLPLSLSPRTSESLRRRFAAPRKSTAIARFAAVASPSSPEISCREVAGARESSSPSSEIRSFSPRSSLFVLAGRIPLSLSLLISSNLSPPSSSSLCSPPRSGPACPRLKPRLAAAKNGGGRWTAAGMATRGSRPLRRRAAHEGTDSSFSVACARPIALPFLGRPSLLLGRRSTVRLQVWLFPPHLPSHILPPIPCPVLISFYDKGSPRFLTICVWYIARYCVCLGKMARNLLFSHAY